MKAIMNLVVYEDNDGDDEITGQPMIRIFSNCPACKKSVYGYDWKDNGRIINCPHCEQKLKVVA